MRDRKLVGSRQRSLSSRFILSRRERPLLAGKFCRWFQFWLVSARRFGGRPRGTGCSLFRCWLPLFLDDGKTTGKTVLNSNTVILVETVPNGLKTVILVKARKLNESRTEANGQTYFDWQGENTALLLDKYNWLHVKSCGLNDLCTLVLLTFTNILLFTVSLTLRPRPHENENETKTELFCSGYGYLPHYNAENDHRKRSHSRTLSRVERFENDAFWKRCFLVWTVKTMLFKNGDVSIQNGGQALPCSFIFAPISRADILKCACVEFIWPYALRV